MQTAFSERRASSLFSTPLFRPLVRNGSDDQLDSLISEFRKLLGLSDEATNLEILHEAFKNMAQTHRSEYFYKNLITSRYFLGRHKDGNATLLNELHIGDAVADCVLINGQGTVYEIKTEFDSPHKLSRQLKNYYKAFSDVYVVIHENAENRYSKFLADLPVGLVVVRESGRISTAKLSENYDSELDTRTIFNLLRRREVATVLSRKFGELPAYPNGIIYEEYLKLAMTIPVLEFQHEMQCVLKARKLRVGNRQLADKRLFPLQSIMVQVDPTPAQFDNLLGWLEKTGE